MAHRHLVMARMCRQQSAFQRVQLLLSLILLLLAKPSLGGEMAAFTEPQMTPDANHRQNVCHRNAEYVNGTRSIYDGLRDMELNVLLANRDYFFYDYETGIDDINPGLMALILDELAKRGGFTWRNNFGVSELPQNETWLDLLLWGVENYDVQGDWWVRNMERMLLGVNFLEPWYDSSLILMTKEAKEVISDEINFTNWLRPYEPSVWALTVFTVLLSGLIYQWIEWLQDERGDRSWWEWWQENWYLSAINFTQAYEYQPTSLAARLFGVSMAIWALVMTATYTANLASMMVDREYTTVEVDSVDQAAVYGFPICVWEGTYAHTLVKKNYPAAKMILKQTEKGLFDGLQNGECKYSTNALTTYEKYKNVREWNPYCDLEWVNEPLYKISEQMAGFAMKVDAGDKCTGFISMVLNVHMNNLREEGVLEELWTKEFAKYQTINCDVYDPSMGDLTEKTTAPTASPSAEVDGNSSRARRQLMSPSPDEYPSRRNNNKHHRILKSGGKGAAAAGAMSDGTSTESQKLTVEQMIGTFVFHWSIMAIAVATAYWNIYYNKHIKKPVRKVVKTLGNSVHKTASGLFSSVNESELGRDSPGDNPANDKTVNNIRPGASTVTTGRSYETVSTMGMSGESKDYMCDIIDPGDQETAPDKSLSQELKEMRAFQMKILEEQRAMQDQMRMLAAAVVPSKKNEVDA